MSKTYRYRDIKPKVAANTMAKLEVKFISDGNTGVTNVEIESQGRKSLDNEGMIELGTGDQLKGKIVSVGAKMPCPQPCPIKLTADWKNIFLNFL